MKKQVEANTNNHHSYTNRKKTKTKTKKSILFPLDSIFPVFFSVDDEKFLLLQGIRKKRQK